MEKNFFIATILALLFTVALLWGLIKFLGEFMPVLHKRLLALTPDILDFERYIPSPRYEEWLTKLRPWGFFSFAVLLFLIIIGILIKKFHLSIIGSIAFFLPIFSYYAISMTGFFFGGIGILMFIWLPLFPFLDFANIIYLPFSLPFYLSFIISTVNNLLMDWLTNLLPAWEIYSERVITVILDPIILGLRFASSFLFLLISFFFGPFIFFLGTMTWLYGKLKGVKIIDFYIYKYSRHPQYLGFLLFTYSLFFAMPFVDPWNDLPPSSLPWLILASIIVGVALSEEIEMIKHYGNEYLKYREKTPFLMPLPRIISKFIKLPLKIIIKKDFPENKKEILLSILVYDILLIILSIPFRFFPFP